MWAIKIKYDGDVSDVGLFTLTWTDPIAEFGIFIFEQRMQSQYGLVMAFVHAAVVDHLALGIE